MVLLGGGSFVGRRATLEEVGAHLGDGDVGAVLLVSGEAGIGKSALLDRALVALGDDDTVVVRSTAEELGRVRPFGLVSDLVAALPWGLSAAAPELIPAANAPETRAAAEVGGGALLSGVDRIVEILEPFCARPLVLVAEDIHWADPASLETIVSVASMSLDRPVTIVVTFRPDAVDHALHGYVDRLRALGAHDLELAPLEPHEVEALVRRLCGGTPSRELLEHLAGARGNPLLVEEYVNGLLEENRLVVADGEVGLLRGDPPQGLRHTVVRRLAELGDDVGAVVRPAAVLGRGMSVTDLAQLCERSVADLTDPLERALGAGILEEDGVLVRFRHELFREAVYHGIPTSLRAALHLRAAHVLAGRNAPAVMVGAHLILGSAPGDPDAVDWLRRAAKEAEASSPATALEFLDRALELTAADADAQMVVQRARLDNLTALGRLDDAAALAEWLLPNASDDAKAELRTRHAGLVMLRGDGPGAIQALARAFEEAPGDSDRARIRAMEALACMTAGDFEGAATAAGRAAELGRLVADPVASSAGLAVAGRIETFSHRYREGFAKGADAVAIADTDATGLAHRHAPLLYYGLSSLDAGRGDVATDVIARGRDLAATHGMDWSLPVYAGLSAALHYRRGRLDDAAEEAEQGVELARRTASVQAKMWCECLLALIAVDRGDGAAAQTWADEATRTWEQGRSPLGSDYGVLAQAAVVEAAGDAEAAYGALCVGWDLFEAFETRSCLPVIAADLARLAVAVGDPDRAVAVLAAVEEAAAVSAVSDYQALADRVAGIVDDDRDRLHAAVAGYRTLDRPLDLADSLADLAASCARDGASDDASTAQAEAVMIYHRSGAPARAARLSARLAGPGRPDTLAGAVADGYSGWSQLTPSEREIVALLAEGLSNKEIAQRRGVSRRTVESQLQRAYSKLGISGRVNLAMEAATELGIDRPA